MPRPPAQKSHKEYYANSGCALTKGHTGLIVRETWVARPNWQQPASLKGTIALEAARFPLGAIV